MTDTTQDIDLVGRMEQLAKAGDLPDTHRKTCERLLARLGSDISVVLAGPLEDAKDCLHQALIGADLARTSLRIAPWQEPLDFGQADICVWCTDDFHPDEALLWQDAPDRLKDHSYLVVVSDTATTAPRPDGAEPGRLDDIALEEFCGLSHVTLGAGAKDARSAPITALVGEVANMVRIGVAADADNAQLFLRTHQPRMEVLQASASDDPPQHRAIPAAAVVQDADQDTMAVQTAATDLYRSALGTMCDHLEGLVPLLNAREDADIQQILSICETTSAAVADVLSDTDLSDPELELIREETLSAADRILLMSLEGGVEPAVDAVTTVLQLRREMELRAVS